MEPSTSGNLILSHLLHSHLFGHRWRPFPRQEPADSWAKRAREVVEEKKKEVIAQKKSPFVVFAGTVVYRDSHTFLPIRISHWATLEDTALYLDIKNHHFPCFSAIFHRTRELFHANT